MYNKTMNITIPPEQQDWLQSQIAQGHFASVDDAVGRMIADHMVVELDDFAWAKPYLDVARSEAGQGRVVALDEAVADIDAHMESLKS